MSLSYDAYYSQLNAVLIQAAVAKFPNLEKLTWTSGHEDVCRETMAKHPYIKMVLHGVSHHIIVLQLVEGSGRFPYYRGLNRTSCGSTIDNFLDNTYQFRL